MAWSKEREKLKVLFVDDEEGVLRSLKRLFMDEDLEIFTALSGKDGLDVVKSNEFAVIVSDQRMPEMSGAEFLEKSKKISPNSVRIVLTGYADINAAMDAINKGGAYRYITKPWDDNDLTITVLNAIETYRLIKENKYLAELTKKQNEELKKWSAELEYYVQQHTVDLTRQNKELKRLNEKMDKDFLDFISAFSNLIELRDETARSHSNNVAVISTDMAQSMGLGGAELKDITIAARLHDIGKIGVPDIVLLKSTDELSPEEKTEYMKHPVRGQAAIDFVEDLREAGVMIRHHHEWYNGKGFPDGLGGEGIPLGARIISIADKFDRLTGGRSGPGTSKNVLDMIRSMLGIQFDPKLFEFLDKTVKKRLTLVTPAPDAIEVELSPKNLMPGMVISRDLISGTGILLLSKGIALNNKNIDVIKRSYHVDPSKTGVFVYAKRKYEKS